MDQLLEELLFLEVIIQKNELNFALHWPRVRLRWIQAGALGALGAVCCAALAIWAVSAHFLLRTLVQITSVLTWLFSGWMFSLSLQWEGAEQVLAGPGGSCCDHSRAHLPTGSTGDGAFLLLPSWKTILLYFLPRQNSPLSASVQVVSHSNSFYFREAVTFMNFCGCCRILSQLSYFLSLVTWESRVQLVW